MTAADYEAHDAPPVGHAARTRCDVDFWSNDKIKEPPEGYVGRHRVKD